MSAHWLYHLRAIELSTGRLTLLYVDNNEAMD
jgi:hypothetical protein